MGILLGVLLAAALIALGVVAAAAWRARQSAATAQAQAAEQAERAAALATKLAALQKYETLLDVESEARRIRAVASADATDAIARARATATDAIVAAEAEAARLVSAGKQSLELIQAQEFALQAELARRKRDVAAETAAAWESAHSTAAQMVRQAQDAAATASASIQQTVDRLQGERAQAEAGVVAANVETKRLERVVQGMRNVIEGYGDRYVLPTTGLLDDLAEEFSFADAGQKLKVARDRTRQLTREHRAAECDYVEAHRRTTAIEFVLDAFNGKVDTILSSVRHDNYGTLRQKIQDSLLLVNHNGAAFRNARITPEYANARLEELRWAVVAQELKLKDREEQRVLKERMREEERAQREYERAMKEAEKEEETLRKAMAKARQEVEKATEDQKAKYEERLREIEERLRIAEEKGERAKSMAEQTRSGHVYVISNVGSFGEEVFKIGMTRRLEPNDRVRELGDASVPFEFDVHAMIPSEDAPALEHALHKRFVRRQVNKVNPRKEFFRMTLAEVREEVERLRIQVSWTMAAEAREYRESQAVERALASKVLDEATWEAGQLARERSAEREPAEALS